VRRFAVIPVLFTVGLLSGCSWQRYDKVTWIETKPRSRKEGWLYNRVKVTAAVPVGKALRLDHSIPRLFFGPSRAANLDASGNVPAESSFYVDRHPERMTVAEIERGAIGAGPEGKLRVERPKTGTTPGFWGIDEKGRKFLVKLDDPRWPELSTGADIVGSRIMHALGYRVPVNDIITVTGTGRPEFDGKRATTSLQISDVVGHASYNRLRNRREFRALRLVAAWINNVDVSEQNTMMTWDGRRGYLYVIDFNAALGSWSNDVKTPGMGWRHLWNPPADVVDFLTFGRLRPYDEKMPVFSPAVGRFDANFDPRRWRPTWRNSAFDEMSEEDARWMARKIAGFTDEKIQAVVRAAKYTRREDEAYIVQTLIRRRDIILQTYDVSPPSSAAATR